MSIGNTLTAINEEVKAMIDSNFEVNLKATNEVPSIDNTGLTFPSVSKNKVDTLELTTCVLFIDIRKSTEISDSHHNKTLVKLYSAFVRSMVKASNYFNGKVRNIIGDRVMVVFDEEDCIKNAIDTAFLLNTVSKYIINKHFDKNTIECGIGIDYGKMQIVKTGSKKNAEENREYKALVWLGNTANIASKLTDLANKDSVINKYEIEYMNYLSSLFKPPSGFPFFSSVASGESFSKPQKMKATLSEEYFLEKLTDSTTGVGHSLYGDIVSFKKIKETQRTKPILITDNVYDKLIKDYPDNHSVKENFWKRQRFVKKVYKGIIYGAGAAYLDAVKQL